MRGLVAIVASMAFAGAANAQSYPDLREARAGAVEVVSARSNLASLSGEGEPLADIGDVQVEVVVDRQKRRRLSGTISGRDWSRHYVGAFATRNTIGWAEPDGHVSVRLLGSDTLDYCYLESKDLRQMAACANF